MKLIKKKTNSKLTLWSTRQNISKPKRSSFFSRTS